MLDVLIGCISRNLVISEHLQNLLHAHLTNSDMSLSFYLSCQSKALACARARARETLQVMVFIGFIAQVDYKSPRVVEYVRAGIDYATLTVLLLVVIPAHCNLITHCTAKFPVNLLYKSVFFAKLLSKIKWHKCLKCLSRKKFVIHTIKQGANRRRVDAKP